MLQLKHELVITHSVYREILAGSSGKTCCKLVSEKKIRVIKMNSDEQIRDYKKSHPQLGDGEIDSMLSFLQISKNGDSTYCIFDDGVARRKAGEMGIKFTGFLGLLKIMREREILTTKEYEEIITQLRKSNFRLPKEIC